MLKTIPSNKEYWQKYKPGSIPSVPNLPPKILFMNGKKLNILDVGTGDGKVAEKLAHFGHNVYGIDIAKNIITENISRKSNVSYSIQDISKRTTFSSSFFDLIISRFVFTNIPKDERKLASKEISRLLNPHGKLWTLEPLVSKSYNLRYKLSEDYSNEKKSVVVFKEKEMAKKITNKKQMEKAFNSDMFSRIVKHYVEQNIIKLFEPLSLLERRILDIPSPSSYTIKTFEGIFGKT